MIHDSLSESTYTRGFLRDDKTDARANEKANNIFIRVVIYGENDGSSVEKDDLASRKARYDRNCERMRSAGEED